MADNEERNVPEESGDDSINVLLTRYSETRSTEVREQLVQQFSGLVESISRSFAGSGEPVEDLSQEGYIGLLKAIDMYDADRGVKFITYASHLILGEIKHYLRDRKSLIREPGWLYELNQRVGRVHDELAHHLGRPPTAAEIAEAINAPAKQVEEVLKTRGVFHVKSLDAEEESETGRDLEHMKAREAKPARALQERLGIEDRLVLDHAMSKLKHIEKQVVDYFFFKELNQTEIAKNLGVSCNYVSHLVRSSVRKLRAALAREEQKEATLKLQRAIQERERYLESLERRGVRDRVTGLFTRSYMEERLREEILRSERYSHPLALILFDVDDLQRFNWRQTKAAGDEALRRIGEIIKSNLRKMDVATLAGGGRFAAILPHTGEPVTKVAERIIDQVAKARVGAASPRGKGLTIRAGAAIYPIDAMTDDGLIEAAARGLENAKKRGGGCACRPTMPDAASGHSPGTGDSIPSGPVRATRVTYEWAESPLTGPKAIADGA